MSCCPSASTSVSTGGVDEFVERCLQLHGPAKSPDLFALRQQTVTWHQRFCPGHSYVPKVFLTCEINLRGKSCAPKLLHVYSPPMSSIQEDIYIYSYIICQKGTLELRRRHKVPLLCPQLGGRAQVLLKKSQVRILTFRQHETID